jgi:hypothetical protein
MSLKAIQICDIIVAYERLDMTLFKGLTTIPLYSTKMVEGYLAEC